jgi:hypothetical protein
MFKLPVFLEILIHRNGEIFNLKWVGLAIAFLIFLQCFKPTPVSGAKVVKMYSFLFFLFFSFSAKAQFQTEKCQGFSMKVHLSNIFDTSKEVELLTMIVKDGKTKVTNQKFVSDMFVLDIRDFGSWVFVFQQKINDKQKREYGCSFDYPANRQLSVRKDWQTKIVNLY